MISDGIVHKHPNMCTHEQCKSSDCNQGILVRVDVVQAYTCNL